jgi:uncharacterized membrane protein YhaH (DUF805 family)
MSWYIEVLKKYAVFEGRAQRQEYWYFVLFNTIAYIVLVVVDTMLGTINLEVGMGYLSGVYVLATMLPTIGVGIRRLHDTSRSGWWLLLALIPLIGGIVLVIFLALDSTKGDNQYGENPKGVQA